MLENYWLEYKTSGQGVYALNTTFKDVIQKAQDMCVSDYTVVCVYNGVNVKVAEVTLRGARWVSKSIQGSICPQ